MLNRFPLEFILTSTNYSVPLMFELYHNDKIIYSCKDVKKKIDVNILLECKGEKQQLSWQMSGKTTAHTKIDATGNIISDAALMTENFKLDGFELKTLLPDNCPYLHTHNGTTETTKNTYDNFMGCNGKVVFDFDSPAHIWILKNWR